MGESNQMVTVQPPLTTVDSQESCLIATVGSQEGCPMREVLNRIGDKWSVLVVVYLREDSQRFSALRRQIEGISQRMLTETLRQLERDGLVQRTVYAAQPVRVEYALTPLGQTLIAPLVALAAWAEQHRGAVVAARAAYDQARQNTVSSPYTK